MSIRIENRIITHKLGKNVEETRERKVCIIICSSLSKVSPFFQFLESNEDMFTRANFPDTGGKKWLFSSIQDAILFTQIDSSNPVSTLHFCEFICINRSARIAIINACDNNLSGL